MWLDASSLDFERRIVLYARSDVFEGLLEWAFCLRPIWEVSNRREADARNFNKPTTRLARELDPQLRGCWISRLYAEDECPGRACICMYIRMLIARASLGPPNLCSLAHRFDAGMGIARNKGNEHTTR